jgi:hypothetical protein
VSCGPRFLEKYAYRSRAPFAAQLKGDKPMKTMEMHADRRALLRQQEHFHVEAQ